MQNFFLTFIIILTLINQNFGQKYADACGTKGISLRKFEKLFYVGNNQILMNELDSVGYYEKTFGIDNAIYKVPVKFWVYRENNRSGGAQPNELKALIKEMNDIYSQNNVGISFYMRNDVEYINNSKHKVMGYYLEAPIQSRRHRSKGCINILVVEYITKKRLFKSSIPIRGNYNKINHALIVRRNSYTTASHEVGHFFGLLHTHHNWKKGKRKQEAVSRTRKFKFGHGKKLICEVNGDGLCDTPAEPSLSGRTNESCKYNASMKDRWGDLYQPDATNIMSYNEFMKCKYKFTAGQVGIMLSSIKKMKEKAWSSQSGNNGKIYSFDMFEPDNSKEMATKITSGDKQLHTFHSIYMGENKTQDFDPADWFELEIPANHSKITITTSKGKLQNADTEVFLYTGAEAIVSTDDNGNGEGYSKIVVTNLKPGRFLIKVIAKNYKAGSEAVDYVIDVKSE